MALLPANPGQALWIGGVSGKNHYNVGIGQGTSGGTNHADFDQSAIEDGYTDPAKFFLNADGNPVFRINASAGRTSSGTEHPRSELRELTLSGARAEWDGRSGDHWARGRCRVTQFTTNRPWVCFAQIHGSEGSPVSSDLIRLQTEGTNGTTTGLSIVARRSPVNGAAEIRSVLRTGYDVNDWFSWELGMFGGRCVVKLDGVSVLDVTGMGQINCYFKAGCYLQDNVEKGAGSGDWASVEYERGSFVTWHTGTPSPSPPVFTGGTDPGGGPGGGDGTADTAPPSVPTGGVAISGATQAALSWDASTDNVGVTGYKVWRFSSTGAPDPPGGADLTTAAGKFGWGLPLASSDEFDYTGVPNASKWSVYDGPGHGDPANGVRAPGRVTVSGGKMVLTGLDGSANTAGLAHDLDQQYGRWEVRCRSFYTSAPPPAGGFTAHVFVAPSGNDSNSGTSPSSPKRTIAAGISVAQPGQTVSVASGSYSGNLIISKSGTAGNYITIRSANKWGAKIIGNGSSPREAAVEITGQYVRFEDFEVTGPGGAGSGARYGIAISAHNVAVVGNHVHTICQYITQGTGTIGGAGIDGDIAGVGGDMNSILIDRNRIHTIGLMSDSSDTVQGIYVSQPANNGKITNNVIYKCADYGIQAYVDTISGWWYINNTVVGNGRGVRIANNSVVRNNIVYNSAGSASNFDIRGAGNVLSNNISGGTGNVSVSGVSSGVNPLFTNLTNDDYTLQSGSPAINTGTSTDAPSVDFDGSARPAGPAVDIGAYEYAAALAQSGGYHPVLIVWPTDDQWPESGEYDLLENGEPGEQSAGAFMHYPSTNSSDQIDVPNFPVDLTAFHNFAFEWTSAHVKGWVDGEPWFSYSGGAGGSRQDIQDMPSGHLTVQLDAFQATGCLASTMELEWARVYDLSSTGAGGGSGATVVLGKNTGGVGETSSSADKIAASRFTSPAAGTVTTGHARVWLSAAGSTLSKMMIYANSGSAPGALLATSDQITITATSEQVRDYPFSGANAIAVADGVDYWVAISWDDPGTPSLVFSRDATTGGRVESTATYGTPPNPFGTVSGTFTGPIDAWCDVVTGGAGSGGGGSVTSSFGKLTDGGSNSASSADKVAASRFTSDVSGTLTAGHARAWLTGGSGSVGTRMVVYADAAGAPGALLATSDETTIAAIAEGMRDYTFSGGAQIAVTSGVDYWIGLAWDDPGTPSLTLSRDATAGLRVETSTLAYPTMPNPFGTPVTGLAGPIDVYLDVTTSTGGGGWILVATVAGTSYVDIGLTAGAVYTYQVSARDAAGNESARSATFAGTPGDPDTIPPSVPENLAAVGGAGRVTLTWNASTDIDSGVGHYVIWVDGSRAATVVSEEFTATALVLVGLTNGVNYSFRVSAVDRAGNESAQSGAQSATPSAVASGGVALLPSRLSAGSVEVAIAWGANLAADEGTWAWTDVTPDVRFAPGISTALGRNDESSTSNPAELTLVLDNSSGDYSLGGRSARWPFVRRNTPVRLRIDPGDGVGPRVVVLAYADGWTPGWDSLKGNVPVVTLSASGSLRRLAQGDAPITSAYRRVMAARPAAFAYWPMEEGKDATYAPATRGGSDFTVTGEPSWGANDDFACSAPLPTLRNGRLVADVAAYPDTGRSQLRWLMSIPANGLPDGTVLAHISMTGTIHRWDLTYGLNTAGQESLGLYRYDAPAIPGTFNSSNTINFDPNGRPCRLGLAWVQSGSNINWQLSITPAIFGASAQYFDGVITGRTAGNVSHIDFNPHSANLDFAVGHITVENQITSLFADSDALIAHAGEVPTSSNGRLTRLCTENRVPIFRYASGANLSLLDRMGPQTVAPLLQLLRECEAADQGQLWDGRNVGLSYTSRRYRELGAVKLTVDAVDGQLAEGFAPVDDDQRNRNRVTVTRFRGVTVTREDTSGPMGTNTIGIYDDAVTINTLSDAMPRQYAQWFVAAGTTPGYRYPSVTVDLAASPELAGPVLDVIPGDRIDVVGLDDTLAGFPDPAVSLIVEGIAHDITTRSWQATFRCSPAAPWMVGEVAAESGDTSDMVMRLDTDGSTLASAASAGATSLSVASTGVRWTTAADDYPLHLSVGGIRVRATACSGASSPQAFTVTALPVARASGAPVKLWEPRRIGLG